MTDVELLEAAIKELKLQKKMIKRSHHYDPTLYRSWVAAIIPSLLEVLKVAESALKSCTHPEDIACWDEQVALAKAILGK